MRAFWVQRCRNAEAILPPFDGDVGQCRHTTPPFIIKTGGFHDGLNLLIACAGRTGEMAR